MRNYDLILRKKGVNPSYQRRKILEFMYNNHGHPTVNEIFTRLSLEIPSLSKATVYNTLNLFREKNLVNMIFLEGNEARYDLVTNPEHGYFHCLECGSLTDIELSDDIVSTEILDGYKVKYKIFLMSGICVSCNEKYLDRNKRSKILTKNLG